MSSVFEEARQTGVANIASIASSTPARTASVIKVRVGGDIRRIPIINEELSYDDLILRLLRVFKLSEKDSILIKYTDDDGDLVTILDNDDLAHARTYGSVLRLTLFVNGKGPSVTPTAQLREELLALSKSVAKLTSKLEQLEDHAQAEVPDKVADESRGTTPSVAQQPSAADTSDKTSAPVQVRFGRDYDPLAPPSPDKSNPPADLSHVSGSGGEQADRFVPPTVEQYQAAGNSAGQYGAPQSHSHDSNYSQTGSQAGVQHGNHHYQQQYSSHGYSHEGGSYTSQPEVPGYTPQPDGANYTSQADGAGYTPQPDGAGYSASHTSSYGGYYGTPHGAQHGAQHGTQHGDTYQTNQGGEYSPAYQRQGGGDVGGYNPAGYGNPPTSVAGGAGYGHHQM